MGAKAASIQPGVPEAKITETFPRLEPNGVGTVGILDVDQLQTVNGTTRTYWVGFRSVINGNLRTKRIYSFTATNGIVTSVYYP